MYLRLVQARAKRQAIETLPHFYQNTVIPALEQTPGCLYACLMQSGREPEDVVSMTLWENLADAEAYGESGMFQHLMKQAQPYLEESTEWRVQLSKEMKLEYSPVQKEPAVSAYPVTLDLPTKQMGRSGLKNMYLRIVSVKLKPDKREEYHRLYINEVIPVLQETRGCRHAYLIMPPRGGEESLSVTIWDSKADADAYEEGGLFSELLNKVKHTFTDMMQWKMELDAKQQKTSAATEELKVEGFSVVAMKSFR